MSATVLAFTQPDAEITSVPLKSDQANLPYKLSAMSVRSLSDEALVAQAKLGCEEALTELWGRHGELARTIAWRITRNREDAEDVLQETYISCFRHLDQFKGESQFSTWMSRIATNSALMLLRKRRNHRQVSIEGDEGEAFTPQIDVPDLSDSIEARCIRSEHIEHLRNAMQRLPIRLRQVIELQQRDGLPMEQITRITGMSMSALKSRLFRARKALRESTIALRTQRGSR